MIKWIAIKETFRNKRFVFFTLIFPLGWYAMMINLAHSAGFFNNQLAYLWVTVACIIGIAGNSVVTFSKKVSDTQQFYRLQAQTSHYTLRRWLLDQSIVQTVLNLSICCVIVVAGLVMRSITLDVNLLVLVSLLLVMGSYLSVIGFLIGIVIDGKTISALSMPLSMGFGILMIRWDTYISGTGTLITVINTIQKGFPGYYLFEIVRKMMQHQHWQVAFFQYTSSVICVVVPLLIILGWQTAHQWAPSK